MSWFNILLILIVVIIFALILKISLLTIVKKLIHGNGDPINQVLFIPGLGNGHESFKWEDASDELKDRMKLDADPISLMQRTSEFAEIISIDPPGINNDEEPPRNISDYINWLHDRTIGSPVICAHSIGCHVALLYAKKYPTRGLILLDPTPEFILQQISADGFYTKTGLRKYEITSSYINMYATAYHAGELVTSPDRLPDVPIVIHYNSDDNDPRRELQSQWIQSIFQDKKIVKHANLGHFFHIVSPSLIVDDIQKI